MAESFEASVQYDDWKGSFAADELDSGGLRRLFDSHLKPNEFIVGFQLWVGENHPGRSAVPKLVGFAAPGTEFESTKDYLVKASPIKLRRIELTIEAADFLMLFKRLEVMAAWKGMPLHGKDFEEI